jgi:excinuclease ABC subunit A
MSPRRYVLRTIASSKSATLRRRALQHVVIQPCPSCRGTRLRAEALAVTIDGRTIDELDRMPLTKLAELWGPRAAPGETSSPTPNATAELDIEAPVIRDLLRRVDLLLELGLGYLSLSRPITTLSAGELQRVRIASQLQAGLFGVAYVLDEPSDGLHPVEVEGLLGVLDRLRRAGNSLLVVEHDLTIIRHADWVIEMGPGAGVHGGRVLYSGPVRGLSSVANSPTSRYLNGELDQRGQARSPRVPQQWHRLRDVSCNNIRSLDVEIPIGVMTVVTGVSGSGKTSLVTHGLGQLLTGAASADPPGGRPHDIDAEDAAITVRGSVQPGNDPFDRVIIIDQKPIGRTPRSNLATYTGLFDGVRRVFAATPEARGRGFNASRFSFNLAGGRCPQCEGEGFVTVELLFLPGTYGPCPDCSGTRYNAQTLEVRYRGHSIADVLDMTVEDAAVFFEDQPPITRSLGTLADVGLGYLRLGQPATELSGGEAQRIKLAAELQRARGTNALYLLDEPTSGLHPADVERLLAKLHTLVARGSTVVVAEHDLDVIVEADWIIELGPGGGEHGGRIVTTGTPADVAQSPVSPTAPYLSSHLAPRFRGKNS